MSKKELQRLLSLVTSLSVLFNSYAYATNKKDKNVNETIQPPSRDIMRMISKPLIELVFIDKLEMVQQEETTQPYEFEISPIEPTYEVKMQAIMEKYELTYEQLDEVCAGCVAESCGEGTNYEDAYAVASTIYNRTSSADFTGFGSTIYDQFVAPNQFSVYASGAYKLYLGCLDLPGYQAAIDMFYSEEVSHNMLSFRGSWWQIDNSLQIVANGNHYFNELEEEDTITNQVSLERKLIS